SDAALAESTERMLVRNQRWSDLVRFWEERVEQLPSAAGHRLREKIAGLWVERLDQPAEALTQLRRLLSESEDDREPCRLLEVILASQSWPGAVRRGALDLLRVRYEMADRPSEIVRILRSALGFADTSEEMALHREIAQRLAAAGDSGQAMSHYATLLVLDPHAGDAREELRRLADELRAHGRLADALV